MYVREGKQIRGRDEEGCPYSIILESLILVHVAAKQRAKAAAVGRQFEEFNVPILQQLVLVFVICAKGIQFPSFLCVCESNEREKRLISLPGGPSD